MSDKSPQEQTLEDLLQEVSIILHGGGVATIREAMEMSWLCDGTLENNDAIDELMLYVKRFLHSHMQTAFDDVIGQDSHDNDGFGTIAEDWEYDRNALREGQRQRAAKWIGGDK